LITTIAVSITTLLAVAIIGVLGYLVDKSADQKPKR
jgi:nitrate reductase NapE component